MGATLVILTGGFDLSAGAVISLVNVALALGWRRRIGLAAGADGGRHRHRHGGGRVQRLLRRRAAAAAHRGDAVHHVHPAGRDAADHGQARRRGGAGAGRVLHGRRRAGPRAHAAGAAGDAGTGLGLVQAHPRRVALFAVGSDAESARAAGLRVDATLPGLCHGRRAVRAGRRVPQRADRLGRSAGGQSAAAVAVRGRGGGRHAAGRRPGGPWARCSAPTS